MKKVLYYINLFALLITLACYCTIFIGMMCQPFLGVIQIISAIIYSTSWRTLAARGKRALQIYWIIVAAYGAIWLFIALGEVFHMPLSGQLTNGGDAPLIGFVFVLPMGIAVYFTRVSWILFKTSETRVLHGDTLDEEFINS